MFEAIKAFVLALFLSVIKRVNMSSTIANQGIVSILGSECDQGTQAPSLRRTFSADMSSRQWLARNGFSFSPMKRISSSEELTNKKNGSSSSYEGNKEPGPDKVLRLIQSHKKAENPNQVDIWASIVSIKANEENSTLPPYVHPLVKKSSSSLSKKSLEICTESLGSETGSDRFSSYTPSETGDTKEEKDETQVVQSQPQQEKEWQPFNLEEPQFTKYNFSTTKKSPPISFPPPLPSLAQRNGPSLHMQARRVDGRLVLEAISIPSHNCFHAHREDGHLLLTFSNSITAQGLDLEELVDQEDEINEVNEEVFNFFEGGEKNYLIENEEETEEEGDGDENEDEEEIGIGNGVKELGFVMDQSPNYSSEVTNVHRSALGMKKLTGLNNRDPKWMDKLMKTVNLVEMTVAMEADANPNAPLSQSLPWPPRVPMILSPPVTVPAASFNAYEYFGRTKPTMESAINPIAQQSSTLASNTHNFISSKPNPNQEMVLFRGNQGDYLVPLVRGCKENKKRSFLFWEPYCIATS